MASKDIPAWALAVAAHERFDHEMTWKQVLRRTRVLISPLDVSDTTLRRNIIKTAIGS